MSDNPYRTLPSVDALADAITTELPRSLAVGVARAAIQQARADIAAGGTGEVTSMAQQLARDAERTSGTSVINASGVLLHTNLGRATWSKRAIERARAAAGTYTNIELDLATGERGRRGEHVIRLLSELTGAEAGLVVNNNASALLLALAATSRGKSVPVARGELIEIGGSYRLPDVMSASGANLVEVGTTNRTRIGDYTTALQTHHCGAILKVHPSNYRVEGFQSEATIGELAELRSAETPLLYDLGSGLLDASAPWVPSWLNTEPGVRQSLAQGADAVLFSGDKLVGGPQAGIVVGSRDLIQQLRSNPLARALRVDGVTLAALGATLESHLDGEIQEIPFWHYALMSSDLLNTRVGHLAAAVSGTIEEGASAVGAGSAPGIAIPTPVVRLAGRQHLFDELLRLDRPVLTRRDSGDLLVDLRAVAPEEDSYVIDAISGCQ